MLIGAWMRTVNEADVDRQLYDLQAQLCKAFAHPVRLQILDLLAKNEMPVSELQAEVGVTTANMSQHLAVLKSAGVVRSRREGKVIYCSLAIPEVKQACHIIRNVLRANLRMQSNLLI